jgi:hypothetical protein
MFCVIFNSSFGFLLCFARFVISKLFFFFFLAFGLLPPPQFCFCRWFLETINNQKPTNNISFCFCNIIFYLIISEFLNFLPSVCQIFVQYNRVTNTSSNINLSPNILVNLSQFFSILSDLECYRSTFSSFTNHL